MPALNCYHPYRFALCRRIAKAGALLLVIGLMACAGGKLTTDRAYSELKPKEQLPERELRELPENLLVKIENVADAGKSYRNYVVLYVNGREMAPVEQMSNFLSKYTYPMHLQHGVYEVRAEYHVVGYWREQTFDIIPDEQVKVLPGKRTMLTCKLNKDYKGRPVNKQVRFRMQYEDVAEPQTSTLPAKISEPAESRVVKITPRIEAQPLIEEVGDGEREERIRERVQVDRERLRRALRWRRPVPEPQEPLPVPGQTLTLQINTTPSGSDVTVDDRYVGQSPLKVTVTADQNHVVQISRAGYQEVVKLIDADDLRGQTMLQLLMKLEPTAPQQ
ncbi:MAG: PEGA domain-containing protein [bacterium]